MNIFCKLWRQFFLLPLCFERRAPSYVYGPEGLFGGRPQPDSSIILGNPVELKNDRPEQR